MLKKTTAAPGVSPVPLSSLNPPRTIRSPSVEFIEPVELKNSWQRAAGSREQTELPKLNNSTTQWTQ